MKVFCIGLILIFAYKITLTYQSDELIKITIPNEKLGDYFRVLEKYESIIDEITNPRYIFGDHENHKKINAKWLITKSKADLIERELKERDIDFTLVSQVATTKHKRNSRQKRDVNNEDLAKIRTKEDCITRYYCLDQVYEWMRYITQKYPNIAEIVEVGESFHNRKLLALKLGYPNKETNKPLFWFDSAVHAREWTTINSVMFTIMNILEEQNKSESLMAKFLNRYDIYFLVVGNPDGYEYSYKVNNMWRKNMRDYSPHQKCFGVDLNRNFELFSKTGGKSSPCASDYKGSEPGSEPETHAIQKFILDRAPRWLSFISIHAFGAFWILNREEENFPNKNEFINHCEKALFSLKRIKQLNNKDFKFGTPKSLLGYSVSGATDTWAQMRAGAKYAFSIEIGPSESENDMLIDGLGFHIDEDNIQKVAKTIYDGLYTYLSTFIDPIPYNERSEIRTFCSNEYENIKKNS